MKGFSTVLVYVSASISLAAAGDPGITNGASSVRTSAEIGRISGILASCAREPSPKAISSCFEAQFLKPRNEIEVIIREGCLPRRENYWNMNADATEASCFEEAANFYVSQGIPSGSLEQLDRYEAGLILTQCRFRDGFVGDPGSDSGMQAWQHDCFAHSTNVLVLDEMRALNFGCENSFFSNGPEGLQDSIRNSCFKNGLEFFNRSAPIPAYSSLETRTGYLAQVAVAACVNLAFKATEDEHQCFQNMLSGSVNQKLSRSILPEVLIQKQKDCESKVRINVSATEAVSCYEHSLSR